MEDQERETTRLDHAQKHEKRLLCLGQRRVEMEVERAAIKCEDCRQWASECREMISVLGALAKKLQ